MQESWLQPYDNDNLGRTIDTINHYSEGAASYIKDKNWKNAEIEQFRKEKRELYNDIPQSYISHKYKQTIERYGKDSDRRKGEKPNEIPTPDAKGGTRKTKVSKTKDRKHHIRSRSRNRRRIVKSKSNSKSKSKSKTKRRHKK
jgi:hypothetical protein